MKINLIAAVNATNGIGFNNTIPWNLPEDLKYFKDTTMGHPVIMGRKTFDSLPKPLSGRINIVVTSRPFFVSDPNHVVVVDSYEEALKVAESLVPVKDVFIIGGLSAYETFWNIADRLFLTRVDSFTPADTRLDLVDFTTDWLLETTTNRLTSAHYPYVKYKHEVYLKKQLNLFN